MTIHENCHFDDAEGEICFNDKDFSSVNCLPKASPREK